MGKRHILEGMTWSNDEERDFSPINMGTVNISLSVFLLGRTLLEGALYLLEEEPFSFFRVEMLRE